VANIGFHLSVQGENGFVRALQDAHALGINTLQIFTKSPRIWQSRKIQEDKLLEFKKLRRELNVKVIVVHSSYLINLGGDDALQNKSVISILDDTQKASALGIEYVVFHPGVGTFDDIRRGLLKLATQIPQNVNLLIENAASNKNKVCSRFESLKDLIEGTNIGVCLDTCHAFVAGYPLYQDVNRVISDLENIIGLNRIPIIHFNDAVGDCGSGLDRHASLLEGKIGINLKYIFKMRY
jgi:deoxyribonuclease-4